MTACPLCSRKKPARAPFKHRERDALVADVGAIMAKYDIGPSTLKHFAQLAYAENKQC